MLWVASQGFEVTSLCIVPRPGGRYAAGRGRAARRSVPPPRDRTPQLEVGDRARDRRQPEREQRGRSAPRRRARPSSTPNATNAPIMPPSTPPTPPGSGSRLPSMPTKKPMTITAPRRRLAERVERRPQHRDVEAPPGDRAEQRRVAARGPGRSRSRTPADIDAGHRRRLRRQPREPPAAADRAVQPALEVGRHQRDQQGDRDRRRRRTIAGTTVSANGAGPGKIPKRRPMPPTSIAGHVHDVGQDEERDRPVGDRAARHARRAAAPTPSARCRPRRPRRRCASPPAPAIVIW